LYYRGINLRPTENDVMAYGLWVSRLLLGASLAAFGPVLAQAPPTAPTPASSSAGTPAAPAAQGSDSSSVSTQSPAPPSAPSAAPTAPATSPPPATPAAPSADTIKKVRMAGYHPETKNGKTLFCQETANLGTRFPTKKCLDEQQIAGVLDIQHQNKDSLNKPFMCAGGGCAGH
jgi:hypothetical protein